ncbi:hypothetical protein [Pumilibacter muris]|uniref:hypothetical protein n=1 Tax=Pumilibacter muris TaxID=2941510 RepID=UPI00203A3E17|nr:hypothetical protein [Pumilibacter muris]
MDFSSSKWIWVSNETGDNTKKCDRVIFRRAFSLEKVPKSATVFACARDTFSIYVNGKPVALGIRGCAGYDVAKYLVKGDNVLGFECLYYGIEANNYCPPETSGFIAACPELQIYSDASFSACRPYSQDAGEPRPSGRFFGFDSYTDGSRGELGGVFSSEYGSTLFAPATEFEQGGEIEGSAPINCEYDGVIKVKKMSKTTEGVTNTYVCDAGGEKIFVPVLELSAMGTEKVEIRSNRYCTPDAWGKSGSCNGVRGIYVCRNGVQKYTSPFPLSGSELIIIAPATVNVKTVDLHVSSYPARRVLELSGNASVKKLIDKCDNTMRACMDGGILNNSDRDRGCDLFALSNFVRSAIFMYDDSVLPLIKHAIQVATENDGDMLVNNALSPLACENPVSSLMFCSRLGALASYYYRTADIELVKNLHGKIGGYLQLWEFEETRLVPRGKEFGADAGYNTDCELIETCLYYSAAKFLLETAADAGADDYVETLESRIKLIEENFCEQYYKGGYFSSGEVCDERANALAVLCGLAGENAKNAKDALRSCENASPAFEGFVIEALGAIGESEEAEKRMLSRFGEFTESESPALPEYFFYAGSACSSLSVSPVSAYVSGVMGLRYTGARKMELIASKREDEWRFEVPAGSGVVRASYKKDSLTVENSAGFDIAASCGNASATAGKGKTKLQV